MFASKYNQTWILKFEICFLISEIQNAATNREVS